LRATFALIGVGGLVAGVLAARSVPHTRAQEAEASSVPVVPLGSALVDLVRLGPIRRLDAQRLGRQLRQLGQKRDLAPGTRRFLCASFVAYLGLGLFGIPLPLLLAERFMLPSSVVFLFFAIQNAAIVVAYPWASRRIQRSGNLRVQRGALAGRLALFAAAAVALAISKSVPPVPILVAAFIVYGITWATFQLSGTAITSRFARPETRGRALGLYNGLAGTGWILAGVGSGYLARWAGYEAAFAASAGCLIVALVILRWVPEPTSDEPAPPASVSGDRDASVGAV
jgi:MFS family permease